METSTWTGPLLPVSEIDRDWRELIDLGPRFPGTPNNDRTVSYLTEKLERLPYHVWHHEFGYLGWGLDRPPALRFKEPEQMPLDCQAFIYCGPTPEGGLQGTLEYVGEHWVIGLNKWPKFAIRGSDGQVGGYISARPDGPPIPQPLSERSSIVPHFIVGADVLGRLREWTETGRRVVVEGEIRSRLDVRARMKNIIASSLPPESDEPRIALCAHLDSMYICPGANDNGGGLSALLALARHYAVHPPSQPIEFIFFNGEEWDLAGSKAFAARYVVPPHTDRYKLLLNLDGVSETRDGLQFWVGPEEFGKDLKQAVEQFGGLRAQSRVYKFPPPLGSDHVPFYNLGIPVCMFTGYDIVKYHLPIDTYWEGGVDSISYVAELTRHLVDHFAQCDLHYQTRETLLGAKPYFWSAMEAEDRANVNPV